MSTETEIDRMLTAYNRSKDPIEQKYKNYIGLVAKSAKPDGKTIRKAFSLFKCAPDDEIKGMLKQLLDRRILVFLGPVGTSHGVLRYPGRWDEKKGKFLDGVVIVDNRYVNNYLGSAGVIAHELRHILDCEETQLKRLNIGIDIGNPDSLNNDKPQERANMASGRIMDAYGFKKSDWSRQLFNEKNYKNVDPRFADNWTYDDRAVVEMNSNLHLFSDKKKTLKKRKCGRRCKNFAKYGYCDRELYFPPCWDH